MKEAFMKTILWENNGVEINTPLLYQLKVK